VLKRCYLKTRVLDQITIQPWPFPSCVSHVPRVTAAHQSEVVEGEEEGNGGRLRASDSARSNWHSETNQIRVGAVAVLDRLDC
jgi:hypothetical protein